MIVIKKIFGKERELHIYEDGSAVLNKHEDRSELGIYTAENLEDWNDEEYLFKISANKEHLRTLKEA